MHVPSQIVQQHQLTKQMKLLQDTLRHLWTKKGLAFPKYFGYDWQQWKWKWWGVWCNRLWLQYQLLQATETGKWSFEKTTRKLYKGLTLHVSLFEFYNDFQSKSHLFCLWLTSEQFSNNYIVVLHTHFFFRFYQSHKIRFKYTQNYK